jgi:transcription factor WhiB
MDWQADARCAQLTPAQKDWFHSESAADRQAAKNVCAGCPVRDPCLVFGLTVGWGVYAGRYLGDPMARRGIEADCGLHAGTAEGLAGHTAKRTRVCTPCGVWRAAKKARGAAVVARNTQIRTLIAAGLSNRAIIQRLGVGGQTVQRVRSTVTSQRVKDIA